MDVVQWCNKYYKKKRVNGSGEMGIDTSSKNEGNHGKAKSWSMFFGKMLRGMFVFLTADTRPGQCPPVLKDQAGICVDECEHDQECINDLKCCPNGCGHGCQTPIKGEMLCINIHIFP